VYRRVVPIYRITLNSATLPEPYSAELEAEDGRQAFDKVFERQSTPLEKWIAAGWVEMKIEQVDG
jgi:hypothetical protein